MRAARLLLPGCLALAVAAPAANAAPLELAVQGDNVIVHNAGIGADAGLAQTKRMRMKTVRINVLWARTFVGDSTSKLRPIMPLYDLSLYQAAARRAKAAGVKVQINLAGPAPAWATANKKLGNYKPDAKAFAEFTRQAMIALRGNVDRVSVWNEPNWPTMLAPQRTAPTQYRALYSGAYKVIRKQTPGVPVLIGELAPSQRKTSKGTATAPLKFIRSMLGLNSKLRPAGKRLAKLQADGFAHHPYDLDHAPTYKKTKSRDDVTMATLSRLTRTLKKVRSQLSTRSGKALDLYLTEYGYLTAGPRRVSLAKHKSYTLQALKMARKARVRQVVIYQLQTDPTAAWQSGLLTAFGTPTPLATALGAR